MSIRFVQLSDVCDLQNGFAFKSTDYVEKSNTCNIRMSNIRPGGSFDEFHNQRYLPDSYANEYKDYLLKDGDLIIAMTDMATETKILGLPTLVNNTTGRNFLLNQRVGKLCKFSSEIYVPYLRHILTAQEVIDYYKSKGAGGLQINISKKDILSVKFPLPSLPAQNKIVAKLDAIFAEIDIAIAAAEANAKNAEALFQSYLTEVFELGGNGWLSGSIGSLCEELFAGGDVQKDRMSKVITSKYTIPIFTNGERNKGLYGFTDIARVTKPSVTISARGTIGYSEVRYEDFYPAIRLIVATPNLDIVELNFFKHAIKSIDFIHSGAAIPQLTVPMLKDYLIKYPKSKKEQIDIAEKLDSLNLQINIVKNSAINKKIQLVFLKQSILHKAFSGEIVKD